jgi:ribonuclease HI
MTIVIYTDGSCGTGRGPGGWGSVILKDEEEWHIYGGFPNTTNNRMELTAVIKTLELIGERHINNEIIIHTDSKYVLQGAEEWMENWKKREWKGVKNIDLWKHLDMLITTHKGKGYKLTWNWVKAHSGNYYNEKADKLAKSARDNQLK